MRLFVGFEFFKTIFQGKKQYMTVFHCLRPRYGFIRETVTPVNLTKNKQVKVQIFAGYLSKLVASKLLPIVHHHW